MSRLNIDPLEHLDEQKVSGLLVVTLEDDSRHKINKVAGDCVGVPDQIKGKLYHFLLEVSFERDYDILNKNMGYGEELSRSGD